MADIGDLIDGLRVAGPSAKPKMGMKDIQHILDSTPLFMRELPEDSDDNPMLEALKSLVFDGEGDESALNFKNHGNELYAQKSYRDALAAYTSGVDSKPQDEKLRISLLLNRAACNLALSNHGAVIKDTGTILALCAGAGDSSQARDPPPKALYRAAQSLLAIGKWDEAADCIERGRGLKGEEKSTLWTALLEKVERGRTIVEERKERERRKAVTADALKKAVVSRGLFIMNTDTPPDNPNPLSFDLEGLPAEPPLYTKIQDPSIPTWSPPPPLHPIIFPCFLLYPPKAMSDLITHFHEDTSFSDQLACVFPTDPNPPTDGSGPTWADWDTRHEYYVDNLVVYAETRAKRLLKVGQGLTLREVVMKAYKPAGGGQVKDGVVLKDGLLGFVVLVKGAQEREWIEEFKSKRGF